MGKGRGKAPNWSDEEDEVLCRAYMSISENRELGTSQSRDKLWSSIETFYNEKKPSRSQARSAKGLSARYGTISKDVTKFASIYLQVQRLQPSGTNEGDMVDRAKQLFKSEENKEFRFLHCWRILNTYPKFMAPIVQPPKPKNLDSQKRKEAEGAEGSEDTADSHDEDRPGGSKQAKMSKQEGLQRLKMMKANVEANRIIAQSQLKLVQLKERELRLREQELQQQKRQSNDAYFADSYYHNHPERAEYDKHRMEVAVKEARFEAEELKTIERGKQKVDEPGIEPAHVTETFAHLVNVFDEGGFEGPVGGSSSGQGYFSSLLKDD